MQIALIGLAESYMPKTAGNTEDCINDKAWQNIINGQILSICSNLFSYGKFRPVIICEAYSQLAIKASRINLPVIKVVSGFNPLDILRFLTCKKQKTPWAAIAFGVKSLKCAKLIKTLYGKKLVHITGVFFNPPFCDNLQGVLKNISLSICGSKDIANIITKNLPGDAQNILCYPGLDLSSYNRQPVQAHPHFVFGMAGSLAQNSGALLTVRAMAALWQKKELPHWEVRMFGSGQRFQQILQEAENLGVASRLSILGDQYLPLQAAFCNAWLAPGSAACEMPEIAGAGFAAGMPVICSQSNFHKERIPLKGALRVDCHNPQELAKAMIALLKNNELNMRIANQCLKLAPLFCLENMCASLIGSVTQSLGEKGFY